MTSSKIKGSLLEFIVRKLLINCGFVKVDPDGKYIFENRGLNFINGKGAAHDADVLMTPPIQMPFSYPYRINFECKSYKKKTGLTIIRNALGLRLDINDFEILTHEQIELRHNTNRRDYAMTDRQRFNYQVGVASIEYFTKDAFEFAANNKIPLISLKWFLPENTCNLFHEITDTYLDRFAESDLLALHKYLKGNINKNGIHFLRNVNSHIKTIIDSFNEFENNVIIGLLESGDMLFMFSETDIDKDFLIGLNPLNAQFYYNRNQPDKWRVLINNELSLRFYLPERIINLWKNESFGGDVAIRLKGEFFSKIFIFFKNNTGLPFRIIQIDREWHESIQG